MKLSLGQAAKVAKKSKGTLSKALSSGKLSGEKDESGTWRIDPAELQRWVDATHSRKQSEIELPTLKTPEATPEETHENSVLKARLEVMEQRFSDAEKTIEDLRTRLDAEATERRQLTAAITDQRERPRKGWLARLTG